jgi:hypothetical protein
MDWREIDPAIGKRLAQTFCFFNKIQKAPTSRRIGEMSHEATYCCSQQHFDGSAGVDLKPGSVRAWSRANTAEFLSPLITKFGAF